MQKKKLEELLESVQQGRCGVEEALRQLQHLPYEDLGFARIDHHRTLRRGFPEVVYCQSKTTEQAAAIMRRLAENGDVLATRAREEIQQEIQKSHPHASYNPMARTIVIRHPESSVCADPQKLILVVSAGTSDMPVAEEAAVTAEVMGNRVEKLYDVGIAGLHRLLSNRETIEKANVLIAVAGMDGALPAVLAGLVGKPVVAVPTSVGYGASFQGIGPLLTMLNACAPGIAVVNIDNGFGAGYFASMINR